jgi:hypothetical protein
MKPYTTIPRISIPIASCPPVAEQLKQIPGRSALASEDGKEHQGLALIPPCLTTLLAGSVPVR